MNGTIMNHDIETTITLNGKQVTRRIAPRTHLIDFLRDEMGLTGSHIGCEHGVCGACTIRLDDKIVRGCLTLAVQANGRRVDTIEGLSDSGERPQYKKPSTNATRCNAAFAHRAC